MLEWDKKGQKEQGQDDEDTKDGRKDKKSQLQNDFALLERKFGPLSTLRTLRKASNQLLKTAAKPPRTD